MQSVLVESASVAAKALFQLGCGLSLSQECHPQTSCEMSLAQSDAESSKKETKVGSAAKLNGVSLSKAEWSWDLPSSNTEEVLRSIDSNELSAKLAAELCRAKGNQGVGSQAGNEPSELWAWQPGLNVECTLKRLLSGQLDTLCVIDRGVRIALERLRAIILK